MLAKFSNCFACEKMQGVACVISFSKDSREAMWWYDKMLTIWHTQTKIDFYQGKADVWSGDLKK